MVRSLHDLIEYTTQNCKTPSTYTLTTTYQLNILISCHFNILRGFLMFTLNGEIIDIVKIIYKVKKLFILKLNKNSLSKHENEAFKGAN